MDKNLVYIMYITLYNVIYVSYQQKQARISKYVHAIYLCNTYFSLSVIASLFPLDFTLVLLLLLNIFS